MLRRSLNGPRCALYMAAMAPLTVTPRVHAQDAPAAAPAQAQLPATIKVPEDYPIYGPTRDRRDVLRRGMEVESGEGDAFLLALAQTANINLICAAPKSTFQVETLPSWGPLGYIDHACSAGGLTWCRQNERTVLMWPQPDEEKMGRTWSQWWKEQKARDEASEAVGDEEVTAALKQLQIAETPEARQKVRASYARASRERLQEQVRDAVLKYLQAGRVQGVEPLIGRTLALNELPPQAREAAAFLARIKTRESGPNPGDVWYDAPLREQFWKQARLHVGPHDQGPGRLLYMSGPDPTGEEKERYFTVSYYDPQPYTPNSVKLVREPMPPRPESGLQLKGRRLPLRQVLDQVQKQSGLTIEVSLPRLQEAHLTLDVRGMHPQEFLQSLSRIFLIEWKIQENKAVAQETSYNDIDRPLLQMGSTQQYEDVRQGQNDRGEEADMARALYDEAGDTLFSPEGFPVTQLSSELQDTVRREAAEYALRDLRINFEGVLLINLERARLSITDARQQPLTSVVRTGYTSDAMRLAPTALSITLLPPGAQGKEIVALPGSAVALPKLSAAVGSQGTVENVVNAYAWAGAREAEARKAVETEMAYVKAEIEAHRLPPPQPSTRGAGRNAGRTP